MWRLMRVVLSWILFVAGKRISLIAYTHDKRGYIEDTSSKYKVEDFLWSGSGDNDNETDVNIAEEDIWWQYTTTVIQTTTVMWTSTATVYRSKHYHNSTIITTTPKNEKKSDNCSDVTECGIRPTSSRKPATSTLISPWPPPPRTEIPFADPESTNSRYWLLTVLKLTNSTSTQFVPADLRRHLANLYELAFRRHQEQHLGASERWQNRGRLRSRYRATQRRRRDRQSGELVDVRLHNVTSGDRLLSIVYSVSVSGHPVLATTAARDMNFVSDAEVVAELGYPVFTKAEPFLKSNDPASEQIVPEVSWKTKYSLLAASVTAIVALVVCLLVFVVVKNCKQRPAKLIMSKDEVRQRTRSSKPASRHEAGSLTEATSELERQRTGERSNEHGPAASTEHSPQDSRLRVRSSGRAVASPHSYLSMPSVRQFPVTPLPESLATVLSHTHQNSSDGEQKPASAVTKFSRHSSLGDDDPGVVGPVVWRTFRHEREDQQDDLAVATDDISPDENVDVDLRDVRKRFNRLLDEALSLRSSDELSDEQNQLSSRRTVTERYESSHSRSILLNRECEMTPQMNSSRGHRRPRTSLDQRHEQRTRISKTESGLERTRNAWCGHVPPTPSRAHSRPLSAGPFHRPIVQPQFVLTDSQLGAEDPAAPIISAIKSELDKIPKYESAARRTDQRPSKERTTTTRTTQA